MMAPLLMGLLLASPGPLDRAVACHEALDFECAEAALSAALAEGLSARDQIQARTLQARLAMAYRDEPRARQAVRAVFALDPTHVPSGVSPALRRIFDEERPPPPPRPLPFAWGQGTWTVITGDDAERWSDGLGLDLGGGVLLDDRWALQAQAGYHDYRSVVQGFDTLILWTGRVGVGRRFGWGPLALTPTVSAGVGRAEMTSVLRDASWWGASGAATVRVAWPLAAGLSLQAEVGPSVFVTSERDGVAAAWLWPLSVGLGWGP